MLVIDPRLERKISVIFFRKVMTSSIDDLIYLHADCAIQTSWLQNKEMAA